MVIGMVVILMGCVVSLQMSETDAERNAKVQAAFRGQPHPQRRYWNEQQDEYLLNACIDGQASGTSWATIVLIAA
jgi:hypothetical protein